MRQDPVSVYQQTSARGASPVGQVVALYDTILRDFRRAEDAIHAGDVQKRVFELNHALTVIAHLRSVLDFERGGEAAHRLQRFYEITRGMVLEANVGGNTQTLRKLQDLYGTLRQAWHEAEMRLRGKTPDSFAVEDSLARKLPELQRPVAEGGTGAAQNGWSA